MKPLIKSVRGVHAVLPEQATVFSHIEQQCRLVFTSSGYEEIRLPVLEHTDLFVRSIGGATDIVQKEMFTFEDRRGDSLTMRPEGTAGCVRAAIEHGLLNSPCRLWYGGSFFRRERPQKGRHRQFYQMGAEAYGMPGPLADAEIITMTDRIWKRLQIDSLILKINHLGSLDTQMRYAQALAAWLKPRSKALDKDSQQRLASNPLRILDSKNPDTIELLRDAPMLSDYLDDESKKHFDELQSLLAVSDVQYEYDPLLVRGLDYYTGMVFEWIDPHGGGQSTVCAGGRYDGLIEDLGGKPSSAVGFALGVERLALVSDMVVPQAKEVDVYFVAMDAIASEKSHFLAWRMREHLPELTTVMDGKGGSVKSQLRRADRSGAKIAVIIGEDEVQKGTASIKDLRGDAEQFGVKQDEIEKHIMNMIKSEHTS